MQPLVYFYDLFRTTHQLITEYCTAYGLDTTKGDKFFYDLAEEAMKGDNAKELFEKHLEFASQRLWTSGVMLQGCGEEHEKELCSIINHAVRCDIPALVRPAAQLIRNINQLVVTRNKAIAMHYPENGVCFRGSGLPDQHKQFYKPGVQYRVPGFLATSFNEKVAIEFTKRAHFNGRMPVAIWRVYVDPRGKTELQYRCKHVNLVLRANVAGEEEFLFAPYSVFTVHSVTWREGTFGEPHLIELVAAIDNRDESGAPTSETLPLAPWY
jgi:hypothetical protein